MTGIALHDQGPQFAERMAGDSQRRDVLAASRKHLAFMSIIRGVKS
jgi:hypothetical protein